MYLLLDQQGVLSVRVIPPREAEWAPFPQPVPEPVRAGLARAGIKKLYCHQAEAIDHIMAGRHTVVTTSTSSGKSLIYTIPVFSAFLADPGVAAIYLTPAKALGQDQARKIRELAAKIDWPGGTGGPIVEVCDGDTPPKRRSQVLETGNIVITTPDMLHFTLLPRHHNHARLFGALRFVIIDEAHTYRGVFGNHVCHVLRRLQRVCRHHGSGPVFVLTTATIGNPGDFAGRLAGLAFSVVDNDTSPGGKKEIVFYEPPAYVNQLGEEKRRLAHYEAARAMATLVEYGHRVIAFGRSRRVVESMFRKITEQYPHLKNAVTPYKATYTPELRRRLEADLFGGRLKGVMATSALELGIDVGDLNVCLMAGFPGSISSTWQQAGRVGRKGQKSLVVLIANEDPLEIFLVRNPDYFFAQPVEKAVVDPRKLQFMAQHLLEAGRELPLTKDDAAFWDEASYLRTINFLRHTGSIGLTGGPGKAYRTTAGFVRFGLRGDRTTYRALAPDGRVLEEYDYPALLAEAYPGAILSVVGRSYLVTGVDAVRQLALADVVPKHLEGFRTLPVLETSVTELNADSSNEGARVTALAGTLTVTTQLKGYTLISPEGLRRDGCLQQGMSPFNLRTTGLWLEIAGAGYDVLHTLEHLLRVVVPWLVMCDRADIGTYVDRENGRIFVYDAYEGGVGLAESALNMVDEVLERAYGIMAECNCTEGCPACIQIPQCQTRNEGLDKKGAAAVLSGIMGRPVPSHLQPGPAKTGKTKGPAINNMTELRLAAREFELKKK
ncbi:MAG TPA: DEAD/DEAH box helicase [Spirochaetia bacterium]|nr:DEAD/DEAH box helicase [Spirochaetia bacterium]